MTSISVASQNGAVRLSLIWTSHAPVTLSFEPVGQPPTAATTQPLVEAMTADQGRNWAGSRYVTTAIGQRLRYVGHRVERSGSWQTVWLTQIDEVTRLEFTSELSIHDDESGLRSRTHVRNNSSESVRLHAVSSLIFADFDWRGVETLDAMTVVRGRSDWLAEGQWAETPLREAGLPGLTYPEREFRSRGCIEASSVSTWSTSTELPVVVLRNRQADRQWSFQLEHNGGWLWQVGELADGLYLSMLGPTDEQHQWQLDLAPGESFTTVPASMTVEAAEAPLALASLTRFRRVLAARPSRHETPVVFNDYMNTINGDPTASVLLPLIDSAAEAGADYFVIDAGWYADDGDWWEGVGEWQPSTRRFPDGLDRVLDRIREHGMTAGLWLEPEVIGVNSPMAIKLPTSAFLTRNGVRVAEHGRYHLDFTSEATTAFLDEVVDRLVNDHGVGYFKFDYNIRAGVGSDSSTPSAGHGLLLHNRAYLHWLDGLRTRHPNLVLENCASGGMREDFATVSHFDLQSTSDQEDVHAYAPVAAAAPMLISPEQAANWAYPSPGMSDDAVEFALSTAMLGRLYLSGWLNRLEGPQRMTVARAVAAHKEFAPRLRQMTPFWPAGLPTWNDEWISLGLHDREANKLYLTLWRRAESAGETLLPLPAAPPGHAWMEPEAVFPSESKLELSLHDDRRRLRAKDVSGVHAARVVTLTAVAT